MQRRAGPSGASQPRGEPTGDSSVEVAGVEVVDATGRSCPIPVLELAKAVRRLPVGGQVRLLATDPAARVDVPVWCRMQRHRLLDFETSDAGVLRFLVERAR